MGDLEDAWKKLKNPKLPETDKESAQRRFDRVYRLAVRGLDIWLDHFLDDWYLEKGFFGCYHPLSMQVRALTCYGSWDWLHGIMRDEYLTPDVSQAISNMRSLWHIGIKEMMHESLCMLEYQYTHVLPAYCDCDSNVKRARMARDVHGVPPHSLSDLSAKQLAKIDKLVEADNEFYEASVEEFMLRLREVETRTGKRILCKSPKV
ncbi:Hypothetical Protein FCC1311_097832 [Hondaea fermentalgiana]|uniref:Uncharacterized protein n=1 Tax=Hondaea fermentalgiana TaxID=2315210 RepID=A0A2R5GRT4_9STRA|nr:Hypothetical Protein FCC1311_097832 [Hondaea fermentalgiana]|eukprot:GBG33560.1 Hypothetical Protein FCC1311_097832 [Hondaea fermentalgiana]